MASPPRRIVDLLGKARFNAGRVKDLLPVALHTLEGELRDTLYVKSAGSIDVTRPRRVYGILNERCNLRCQGCHYWRIENYAEELSPADWIRALAGLKDFIGSYHINFSGGEPLLKQGLFDILNYCRDNGILAGLTTNGIIVHDRQAAQLVDARLFTINVSLDGSRSETHDLQRGVKGSYNGVRRTIDLMQKHSKATGVPVPIVIKPTVSRLNFEEMPELVKLVSDLGVNGVLFQPVSDWGTPEADDLWITDMDRLREVVERLIEMKVEGYPILSAEWHIRDWVRHFKKEPLELPKSDVQCWVGITTLVFMANGDVRNCHTLDPIGNVKDGSIRDIWYGEIGKQRRKQTVQCTRACSENCNIKRSIGQQVAGAVRLLLNQS